MARVLRWIVGTVAIVVGLTAVVAVAGSQLSLDREHAHRSATAELPFFEGFGESGLVRIRARSLEFRARIAGSDGPGVILLHGFPTTSAMYGPLLQEAASGYRVVAFDQRGYSPGARPSSVEAYAISELTADVLAVADAVGFERFHLVGHDWGSAVGWSVVLQHPERVLSWTGLSIPHPRAFLAALQDDPDQQSRSAYFRLFTTPWLPETLFTFNGLAMLKGVYASMPPAERDEYLRVFAEPGALTAGLNWYRASLAAREDSTAQAEAMPAEVSLPTLFIWGNADEAVGRRAVEAQRIYMKGPYREIELAAGHWLLEEQSTPIVPEILAHWSTPPFPR